MERKDFLKSSLGFMGISSLVLHACNKDVETVTSTTDSTGTTDTSTGSCTVSPSETEGPYPYPDGELKNPLDRSDITGGQTGLPLTITLTVVNVNDNCNPVSGARVDIWHCNAGGYYSGYGNQNGGDSGTKSYLGETWLRGYQTSDANGQVTFITIYPGWYVSRATHIHLEVYINNVMKNTTQIAFPESISNAVYVTSVYASHGTSTTSNSADNVFGNSATDLANETLSLTGNTTNGYSGSHTIGLAL